MSDESRDASPHPYRRASALFTDLYEINMASVYFELSMFEPAVFSLFCRRLPKNRPFIVSCGLEELLSALSELSFTGEEIDYLAGLGLYTDQFLDYLSEFSFSGTVRALPEGSIAFAQEPLLEVTAPLPEAQLIETLVINKMQHPTLAGSKAALCYIAAEGRTLVDFGARRAHSSESAAAAARAAYIAGFAATSNVEAAALYGIPPAGTMAHSFVQAFPEEIQAFRAFAERFGDRTILLIDTYDTEEGARKAVQVARELEASGVKIRGVRIDSGDLAAYADKVRRILDEAGCGWMQIFASGNLTDKKVAEIVSRGSPVDAFGVGTDLSTSSDAPSLDIVYKLVRYGERDVFKLSPQKATYPGPKQVFRARNPDGKFLYDVVTPVEIQSPEEDPGTELDPLLEVVMENGRLMKDSGLEEARRRFLADLEGLPKDVARGEKDYEVRIHPSLKEAIGAAKVE